MKVLLIVAVACLLGGAEGFDSSFFNSFKNIFQTLKSSVAKTLEGVKEPFHDLLSTLTNTVKEKSQSILVGALANLVGGLSKIGQPSTRDISLMSDVKSLISQGKDDISQLIDQAVDIYHGAMAALRNLIAKFSDLEFIQQPIEVILKKIKDIVDVHDIFQNGLLQSLTKDPAKFLSNSFHSLLSKFSHKRSLGDIVQNAKDKLASLFSAFTGMFKQHMQNVGAKLGTALSGHVSTLKGSLQELLQHGHNMVDALKAAVTDIGNETMNNMKPAIKTILGTSTDAIKTLLHTVVDTHLDTGNQ